MLVAGCTTLASHGRVTEAFDLGDMLVKAVLTGRSLPFSPPAAAACEAIAAGCRRPFHTGGAGAAASIAAATIKLSFLNAVLRWATAATDAPEAGAASVAAFAAARALMARLHLLAARAAFDLFLLSMLAAATAGLAAAASGAGGSVDSAVPDGDAVSKTLHDLWRHAAASADALLPAGEVSSTPDSDSGMLPAPAAYHDLTAAESGDAFAAWASGADVPADGGVIAAAAPYAVTPWSPDASHRTTSSGGAIAITPLAVEFASWACTLAAGAHSSELGPMLAQPVLQMAAAGNLRDASGMWAAIVDAFSGEAGTPRCADLTGALAALPAALSGRVSGLGAVGAWKRALATPAAHFTGFMLETLQVGGRVSREGGREGRHAPLFDLRRFFTAAA